MVKEVRPPTRGGDRDDNEETKTARERLPILPSPKTNEAGEHTPSFIGKMHPSVVRSQSATYLVVSAKLSNMQTKLASKSCYCSCHSTCAVVVWRSKSRFARDTDCRTVQDITGCHRS